MFSLIIVIERDTAVTACSHIGERGKSAASAKRRGMISIRYADLPEGLHAQAAMSGRRTIIYLRPGLTPQQRRHSLRRARQSARMGHGPRLPAAMVALAVAGDIAAGTLRNVGAAVRSHVLGALLLVAGTAGAVVCYACSSRCRCG